MDKIELISVRRVTAKVVAAPLAQSPDGKILLFIHWVARYYAHMRKHHWTLSKTFFRFVNCTDPFLSKWCFVFQRVQLWK